MKYQIKENMPYLWLSLLVLIIFYGIYFAKMLVQRRQGKGYGKKLMEHWEGAKRAKAKFFYCNR